MSPGPFLDHPRWVQGRGTAQSFLLCMARVKWPPGVTTRNSAAPPLEGFPDGNCLLIYTLEDGAHWEEEQRPPHLFLLTSPWRTPPLPREELAGRESCDSRAGAALGPCLVSRSPSHHTPRPPCNAALQRRARKQKPRWQSAGESGRTGDPRLRRALHRKAAGPLGRGPRSHPQGHAPVTSFSLSRTLETRSRLL